MFICEDCLKNFDNVGFSGSYGPCEICSKNAHCYDIPSKYLVPKKEAKKEGDSD